MLWLTAAVKLAAASDEQVERVHSLIVKIRSVQAPKPPKKTVKLGAPLLGFLGAFLLTFSLAGFLLSGGGLAVYVAAGTGALSLGYGVVFAMRQPPPPAAAPPHSGLKELEEYLEKEEVIADGVRVTSAALFAKDGSKIRGWIEDQYRRIHAPPAPPPAPPGQAPPRPQEPPPPAQPQTPEGGPKEASKVAVWFRIYLAPWLWKGGAIAIGLAAGLVYCCGGGWKSYLIGLVGLASVSISVYLYISTPSH